MHCGREGGEVGGERLCLAGVSTLGWAGRKGGSGSQSKEDA